MSFKDYYEKEKKSHLALRDAICDLLKISKETFYLRLRENNWTSLEKSAIADMLGIDVEKLFPSDTIAA